MTPARRWLVPMLLLLASLAYAGDVYQCPMRCEGAKTYLAPGRCPVCGMPLEKKNAGAPLNSLRYRIDLTTSPAVPRPGQPTEITLTPRSTADNSVVPLPKP